MIALLHFITDDTTVKSVLDAIIERMPEGSFLILTHGYNSNNQKKLENLTWFYSRYVSPIKLRSREELEALFNSLDLQEKEICHVSEWNRGKFQGNVTDPFDGVTYTFEESKTLAFVGKKTKSLPKNCVDNKPPIRLPRGGRVS
jgi:hypothetical protein